MEEKFSLSDVIVLKSEDLLNGEGLSKIIGGIKAPPDVAACLCKCDKGNCYGDD